MSKFNALIFIIFTVASIVSGIVTGIKAREEQNQCNMNRDYGDISTAMFFGFVIPWAIFAFFAVIILWVDKVCLSIGILLK